MLGKTEIKARQGLMTPPPHHCADRQATEQDEWDGARFRNGRENQVVLVGSRPGCNEAIEICSHPGGIGCQGELNILSGCVVRIQIAGKVGLSCRGKREDSGRGRTVEEIVLNFQRFRAPREVVRAGLTIRSPRHSVCWVDPNGIEIGIVSGGSSRNSDLKVCRGERLSSDVRQKKGDDGDRLISRGVAAAVPYPVGILIVGNTGAGQTVGGSKIDHHHRVTGGSADKRQKHGKEAVSDEFHDERGVGLNGCPAEMADVWEINPGCCFDNGWFAEPFRQRGVRPTL